jgi:hypothetical protein
LVFAAFFGKNKNFAQIFALFSLFLPFLQSSSSAFLKALGVPPAACWGGGGRRVLRGFSARAFGATHQPLRGCPYTRSRSTTPPSTKRKRRKI